MTDIQSVLHHKSDTRVWIFGIGDDIAGIKICDFVKKIEYIENIEHEDSVFSYPCCVESRWIDSKTKETRIKGLLNEYGRFELKEIWCLNMCDDCRKRSMLLTCNVRDYLKEDK